MTDTRLQNNAIELLNSLSVENLESRLSEIKAEETALRTLLRSLKAKARAKRRSRSLAASEEGRRDG